MSFKGLLLSYISNGNQKEKKTDFHNDTKLSYAYECYKAKDYTFLANMLHHSIYVWEFNNADEKIQYYIDEVKNNAEFQEWIKANTEFNEDAFSLVRNWNILQ